MKFPLKWLLEYCPVESDIDAIARFFTFSGTEVENIEKLSDRISGVVVGEVVDVAPNDPLPGMFRVTVEHCKGCRTQVLSRAPNIAKGKRYPFAPVGATLFGGKKIGVVEFERVKSEGMLCSGIEIGLGEPKEKLLELPAGTEVGMDIRKLLGWDDVAVEVEITPNRPDCYGIIGLARELSAVTGVPLEDERHMPIQTGADAIEIVGIEIKDRAGCPRYTARILEKIKIGPSPLKVMGRLSACGVRPINNVVDATNYVMLLLAHPLHAFDLDRLNTERIVVRSAKEGEKFVTLDGEEWTLRDGYVMIATPERAIAIAGIMGGQDSEVTENTKRILLESAYFNPRRIRKASRQLGLVTESSIRFERGVDPNGTARASDECAALISYSCDACVRRGIVDAYPEPIEPLMLDVAESSVKSVLGIEIKENEYSKYLEALGFSKTPKGCWIVPTYRPDIAREIDVVEEIGRLHGYEKVPPSLIGAGPIPAKLAPEIKLQRKITNVMTGLGFLETMTDSQGKIKDFQPFAEHELALLENPISNDYAAMRPSLLPCLLNVAAYNINRGADSVRVFEFDKTYWKTGANFGEEMRFNAIISGFREPLNWENPAQKVDFFDMKGVVESLLSSLGIEYAFDSAVKKDYLVENKSLAIFDKSGKILGEFGLIKNKIASAFGLEADVFSVEILADALIPYIERNIEYKGIPKFPSVERDVTCIIDRSLPVGGLLNYVRENGPKEIEKTAIVSIYEGENVPAKKSICLKIVYRDAGKTLTDEAVNAIHANLVNGIIKNFKAEIPGWKK